jgi:hypothetical protein
MEIVPIPLPPAYWQAGLMGEGEGGQLRFKYSRRNGYEDA